MSNLVNQAAKKTADKKVLGASVTNIETRADALTPEQLIRLDAVVKAQFNARLTSVTSTKE